MGMVYHGLPIDLVKDITGQHKPDVFIETGTFTGDSVAVAETLFPTCYSIEVVEELYEKATLRFADKSNVHLLLGDSAEKIAEIDFSKYKSAFFWLDAHYSGGITGGKQECPLIKEISYISKIEPETYIFIDDARFILSPYQGTRYCTIEELFAALPEENHNVIINDIIMSAPMKAKDVINAYCAEHTKINRKIRSKRVRALLKSFFGDL